MNESIYWFSLLSGLLPLLLLTAALYPLVLIVKLLMRLRVYLELLIEKEEAAAEVRDEQ